jgi:hypothetical protein
MTQSDIIRLAQEAGFDPHDMSDDFTCNLMDINRFANLVAAAEREACAKLCFQMWNEWMDNESISELNRPDAEDCAHAIRKRGLDNLNKEAEKNGEEL